MREPGVGRMRSDRTSFGSSVEASQRSWLRRLESARSVYRSRVVPERAPNRSARFHRTAEGCRSERIRPHARFRASLGPTAKKRAMVAGGLYEIDILFSIAEESGISRQSRRSSAD